MFFVLLEIRHASKVFTWEVQCFRGGGFVSSSGAELSNCTISAMNNPTRHVRFLKKGSLFHNMLLHWEPW